MFIVTEIISGPLAKKSTCHCVFLGRDLKVYYWMACESQASSYTAHDFAIGTHGSREFGQIWKTGIPRRVEGGSHSLVERTVRKGLLAFQSMFVFATSSERPVTDFSSRSFKTFPAIGSTQRWCIIFVATDPTGTRELYTRDVGIRYHNDDGDADRCDNSAMHNLSRSRGGLIGLTRCRSL